MHRSPSQGWLLCRPMKEPNSPFPVASVVTDWARSQGSPVPGSLLLVWGQLHSLGRRVWRNGKSLGTLPSSVGTFLCLVRFHCPCWLFPVLHSSWSMWVRAWGNVLRQSPAAGSGEASVSSREQIPDLITASIRLCPFPSLPLSRLPLALPVQHLFPEQLAGSQARGCGVPEAGCVSGARGPTGLWQSWGRWLQGPPACNFCTKTRIKIN